MIASKFYLWVLPSDQYVPTDEFFIRWFAAIVLTPFMILISILEFFWRLGRITKNPDCESNSKENP